MSLATEIDEAIASGKGNATLIEWDGGDVLFDSDNKNPEASILSARYTLQTYGWKWNPNLRQMERDGWKVWFRGQGKLSRPIAQWSRIK